ncbi:hypothetical protein GCM10025857_67840 [Alicyclobacillus contaminans]|uniref:YqaJ viral recombinase family nuclease n=1 Tax=Alicyclobacillus contaminans TaxID=392016 RepID=UPI000429FBA9|nr:YqaJ viral recombinase family protein [Alicyclobacillus contaminans]GMA52024.1 hypothetical protein GCM10025857_33810 [Alicyclobacillus contaminans]GMA55427.1 hypothetical protein GCM10025857_67840 [Alicyclobacillus contaminans]
MHALKVIHTVGKTISDLGSERKITGSRIGAIVGLNPYVSRMEVFVDLTVGLPEKPDNEAMYWGRELENRVAKEYTIRTGRKIRRVNYLLQHPLYEWAQGNVDRFVYDKELGTGVLEVKTASEYANGDWSQGIVPPHYMAQLQWYLFVTGLSWGAFAVLVGGNKFYMFQVDRDNQMIDAMFQEARRFWFEHVLTNTPPEVDPSESCKRALAHLYPEAKPESVIELTAAAQFWADEYLAACQDAKDAEQRKEQAANELKAMLGDYEVGTFNGQKIVTWKNGKRGRTFRVIGGHE